MKKETHYLAIDLGASSGRGVVGSFDGERLTLEEVHRFENGAATRTTGLHWDTKGLFTNVKKCLKSASARGFNLAGVGIDTWGVDYGLLGESGELIAEPFHYRDERTAGLMDEAARLIGREHIYARTGIAFLPFNTLYQLMAEQKAGTLAQAKSIVFMPDLLNYWLTGVLRTESTIASTSQFFDPNANTWATDVLEKLGLPSDILPPIGKPGTVVGKLSPEIERETACPNTSVIAPASHDTGSAVVAVPAAGANDWAYISSGTWSLVGRELKSPLCSPEAMKANFTNECGLAETIRFQKNVTGLWILQVCQRIWAVDGNNYSYEFLDSVVAATPEFESLIDPDDASFAMYSIMWQRIREFCTRTGQPVPSSVGATVRCILESLALKCAVVVDELEQLTGKVNRLYIVGGGVNNATLCQFTANATGRTVFAGPVEATAIGNIMAQALAMGEVTSIREIRGVVAESFPTVRYEPKEGAAWRDALARFRVLIQCGAGKQNLV